MRAGSWKIAIFGTNTYYTPDSNSEVDLTTLGTADPMTDTDWLVLEIYGGDPGYIQKEKRKRTGGITKNARGMQRSFTFRIMPFVFPDDQDTFEKLWEHLDHTYVYIYKGTYTNWDSLTFDIHADDKAMQCAATGTLEEKYKDGTRIVNLNVVKVLPTART